MLAFAMYLFDSGAIEVHIYPDGEHGKRFAIHDWLVANGFRHENSLGKTVYAGTYLRGSHRLTVSVKSGNGDVVGELEGRTVFAECKGGVINSRHAGVAPRLRRGLCEAIGLLFVRDPEHERLIAVVPDTETTSRLASRLAKRAKAASIEIALVRSTGEISFVQN
ncbi:MAG TPA: hypothetical protein VMF67_02350 [Rhizomicrobium sp.]|nr:hypothetical protein [Rhizomicrobium sp.]